MHDALIVPSVAVLSHTSCRPGRSTPRSMQTNDSQSWITTPCVFKLVTLSGRSGMLGAHLLQTRLNALSMGCSTSEGPLTIRQTVDALSFRSRLL